MRWLFSYSRFLARQWALAGVLLSGLMAMGAPVASAQTLEALERAQQEVTVDIEPTTIVFDLYLVDEYRGEVLVTYTDEWARFHDPSGVMDLVPEINDREAVLGLLNHGKIMNLQRTIENVGKVQLNPSNFQVQVTLEPAVLDLERVRRVQADVEPENTPKLLNELSFVTTNNFEGEGFEGTFRHQNALSLGRNRIEFEGTYSDELGYQFVDLLGAHEQDETVYRAGAMETRGLEFARQQDILGFSAGSNIETLYDNELAKGAQVQVFVPGRSRVRVFGDGQLIYTDILGFGLQELDTASFPRGSYELRIEVEDLASGQTTVESQFFTKTNRLVPFGRPEWLVMAGFMRDELNPNTDEPVWQVQFRNRYKSNYELGISALGGKDLTIVEPQARMFWKNLELRGNMSVTDGGDVAVSGFAQYLSEKYGTLTAQMRRTIAGHNRTPSLNTDIFNPLVGHQDLLSAQWVRSFGPLQLRLRGTRTVSEAGTERFVWGPSMRYPIYKDSQQRLEIQGDYFFINQNPDNFGGFLTYQYTPQPSPWIVRNDTTYRQGQTGSQKSNITQLEFDDRASGFSPGTEVLLTNTTRQSENEDDFVGQDVRLQHTTSNFEATVTGTHGRSGGESASSIGISGRTNFVVDGKKARLVGNATGQANLVVDLTGSARGETMLVKNGNQTLGKVRVGERASIGVQPFKTYNITLEPEEKDSLVSYENSPRTFKLINRGVEVVEYKVNRVLLVFGRLIDEEGNPLSWQRVKGASTPALTDQFGNFQAEFATNDVIYVQNRAKTCTAAIPQLKPNENLFSYVGDVLCL